MSLTVDADDLVHQCTQAGQLAPEVRMVGCFQMVDQFEDAHRRPRVGRLVGRCIAECVEHGGDVEVVRRAGVSECRRATAAVVEVVGLELSGERRVSGDDLRQREVRVVSSVMGSSPLVGAGGLSGEVDVRMGETMAISRHSVRCGSEARRATVGGPSERGHPRRCRRWNRRARRRVRGGGCTRCRDRRGRSSRTGRSAGRDRRDRRCRLLTGSNPYRFRRSTMASAGSVATATAPGVDPARRPTSTGVSPVRMISLSSTESCS